MDRWDKEFVANVCNGLLLARKKKKKEILPFARTWLDLEGIVLSELGQTEKDKYYLISFICGI